MLAEPDLQVTPHATEYRVDGEVGRFRFGTFDVAKPNGRTVFRGIEWLPPLKGREWYETSGFKELALITGTLQRSYRKTVESLNRSRHQPKGGTPLNTLRDTTESEGAAVLRSLETESAKILREHHFAEDGRPLPEAEAVQASASSPAQLASQKVEEAWQEVERQMREQGMSEGQIQDAAKLKEAVYEDPAATVNVHVDDVGVKQQKEHRVRQSVSPPAPEVQATAGQAEGKSPPVPESQAAMEEADRKRPMVYSTVARIEHSGQGFTLAGGKLVTVLGFVVAFLMGNNLAMHRWLFYTDGKRDLQNTILAFFRWHRYMSIVLDWYHLLKKCKNQLSLALKGREARNRHAKQILRLLWYGLVSHAIEYVRAIPEEEIKNRGHLERLVGYFERNRAWLPCYALRRRLGLANSSNPVERTNNLVTSNRQKRNGMSWSQPGSLALTILTAVVLNGHTPKWLKERIVPFVFAQAT